MTKLTIIGRGWAAAVWACGVVATAAMAGQAPTTTQPRPSVQSALAEALSWVSNPESERVIEAFAPAVDIRCRTYLVPKPLRVWIARIDVGAPGVQVTVTEPADGAGGDADYETRSADTLEFARQRGVQLAVNSSAFDPFRPRAGMPMNVVGLAASRGQPYSQADERFGAMYISRHGEIALKAPPLGDDHLWHVVPGFRMLVDDGAIAVTEVQAQSRFGGVNPRTAVGVDRPGRTLWIVVADGRQPGVSEGMTLVELAALFVSLGAWDALNLDGGGSSTLVVENADHTYSVLNTPVGTGEPGTLRQVANNLGFRLPGAGPERAPEGPTSLRNQVIRLAWSRRGGGYKWAGHGVSKNIDYDGETILRASPQGTYCCGATLETFLDAYCLTRYGGDTSAATGRWFEDWSKEQFVALQQGWWGTQEAPTNPLIPADARATVREKQVYHMLPWTGLGEAVDDYHLLQRGDFVQFWRRKGSGHSAIFWGRDRDEVGRERLWYWSSQGKPRHAYPTAAGKEPVTTPGYGINWEYVGEEIDPNRIYGVRIKDPSGP